MPLSHSPLTTSAAPGLLEILLLAEADSPTAALASALGETGRTIHRALGTEEAARILDRRHVGLVIMDLLAGGSDGRLLLEGMRESPRTAAVPAIVISPPLPPAVERECRSLGAVDVLLNPVSIEQIEFVVGAVLERCGNSPAETLDDPATGLPNRAAFREQFDLAVSLLAGTGEPLSMALISFDGLESVGGGLSRASSDGILLECLETVRRRFPKSDTLARWDEETFALLLPDTQQLGAARACEDAARELRERRFEGPAGPIPMTLAAGCVDVGEDGSLATAAAIARRCLFMARAAGGASVFSAETTSSVEPARVLVVAADESSAAKLSRGIESGGLMAIRGPRTIEALRAAAGEGIALIVLETGQTGSDTLEILDELAGGSGRGGRSVLLAAPQGAADLIARCLEAGADDFIVSPFPARELQWRVFRLLDRIRPAGAGFVGG